MQLYQNWTGIAIFPFTLLHLPHRFGEEEYSLSQLWLWGRSLKFITSVKSFQLLFPSRAEQSGRHTSNEPSMTVQESRNTNWKRGTHYSGSTPQPCSHSQGGFPNSWSASELVLNTSCNYLSYKKRQNSWKSADTTVLKQRVKPEDEISHSPVEAIWSGKIVYRGKQIGDEIQKRDY